MDFSVTEYRTLTDMVSDFLLQLALKRLLFIWPLVQWQRNTYPLLVISKSDFSLSNHIPVGGQTNALSSLWHTESSANYTHNFVAGSSPPVSRSITCSFVFLKCLYLVVQVSLLPLHGHVSLLQAFSSQSQYRDQSDLVNYPS